MPMMIPPRELSDLAWSIRKTAKAYDQDFIAIFKVSLRKFMCKRDWNLGDMLAGFDVVAFDEFLKVPDGTSTREHVLAKYGDAGVALIETILKEQFHKK